MNRKLILKNVRFSFVRVFEASDKFNSGSPRYEVTLLIPKSDKENIKKVRDAIKELQKEYLADNPRYKMPVSGPNAQKWTPFYDGDDMTYDGFEGCYFIRAYRPESKGRPLVLDKFKNIIDSKEKIYSGCWGVASIDAYVYNNAGLGITFGLNGLQKVRDDEAFGAGGPVDADFEDESDLDDDPLLNDDLSY